MKKLVLGILLIATAAFAAQPTLFEKYEAVRQALLKNDIAAVQSAARQLGTPHANQLASAKTIKEARAAFAAVSQDVIAYSKSVSGAKPVVLYCSMEKKSWLQPTPSPVVNPYVDAGMRSCGEIAK